MNDCLFCKIANGEIPSTKVYEDDEILAFKDIHPVAPVHILVIPKKHFDDITKLSEKEMPIVTKLFNVMNQIAKKERISEEGFRIVNNCGKNGGQEVKHLHFHLIGGKKLGTKIVEE